MRKAGRASQEARETLAAVRKKTRFASLAETLEVLMDKQTMRRVRLGQKQYSRRQHVVAKAPVEIRKALLTYSVVFFCAFLKQFRRLPGDARNRITTLWRDWLLTGRGAVSGAGGS